MPGQTNRVMLYFLAMAAIIILVVFWYSQIYLIEEEAYQRETIDNVMPIRIPPR